MNKMIWHPASELPPLHEESFEDDGTVYRSMVSNQVIAFLDDGQMAVVKLDQSKIEEIWFDDYGNNYNDRITHWMPLPELPREVRHG